MNIIPRESMDLLPKNLKEKLLSTNSKLKSLYPLDYDLVPYDRAWEYAWHAHIPPLDLKKIDDFVADFDWNSIPEEFKKRNKQGYIYEYKLKNGEKVNIIPTFKGFEEISANIEIKKYRKNFDCMKEI